MVEDGISRSHENGETTATVKIVSDGHKLMKKKNGATFAGSGNLFACTICKKIFKNHMIYRKHLKIHSEKSFVCPLCSKVFSVKHYLLTHMVSHAKTQHFQCHLCHKHFSQKANLNQHLKFHSNKKPYKCRECGKDFYQQEHMKAHLQQHSNERPYQCEMCDKSFNIKSSLQRHMNCHTGVKPFICDICNRGYTRRSVLTLHVQQVHENKKPYQCSVCDMCFSQKGNLQAHFKRKHIPQKSDMKDGQKSRRGIRKPSFKHGSKMKKNQVKSLPNSSNSFSSAYNRTNNNTNGISLKLHSFQASNLKSDGLSSDMASSDSKEDIFIMTDDMKFEEDELNITGIESNDIIRFFNLNDDAVHNGLSDSSDSLPTFHNPYTFSNENLPDDIKILSEFDMLLNTPTDLENFLFEDPDILDPSYSHDMFCPSEKLKAEPITYDMAETILPISLPSCHDYACPPPDNESALKGPTVCNAQTSNGSKSFPLIKKEIDTWLD